MNPIIPGLLAILLYLLASGLLAARLSRGTTGGGGRAAALLAGIVGLLAHGALLFPLTMTPGGLNLGFFNAASLVALITVALLLLAAFQEPVENLGIPVFPVAAITIALVVLYPEQRLVTSGTSGWQLDAHILISLLAYSVLGLAVLYYSVNIRERPA